MMAEIPAAGFSPLLYRRKMPVARRMSPTKMLGFVNVLYSNASPLDKWTMSVKGDGLIKRVTDQDVKMLVMELTATNINTTSMHYPKETTEETASIKLPFLVMLIKNFKRYCYFEIEIMDDLNERRVFRVSNFQSVARVRASFCSMPLRLSEGWNLVHINLVDLTRKAFGTEYSETLGLEMHANCRVWGIFFADRQSKDTLPWCLMVDQDGRSNRTSLNDIKNKFLSDRMNK